MKSLGFKVFYLNYTFNIHNPGLPSGRPTGRWLRLTMLLDTHTRKDGDGGNDGYSEDDDDDDDGDYDDAIFENGDGDGNNITPQHGPL